MKAHLSKNKAVINQIATFANLQCKRATSLSTLPLVVVIISSQQCCFIGENAVNLLIE